MMGSILKRRLTPPMDEAQHDVLAYPPDAA